MRDPVLANQSPRRRPKPLPATCSPLLVPLDDADAARCGAKAANLAHLRRLGLPVPPGVVLTAEAFEAFLDAGGLRARIAATLAGVCSLDPTALHARAERVRALVERAPLPAAVTEALATVRFPGRFVVRSSAIGEDSLAASFAGQLAKGPLWPRAGRWLAPWRLAPCEQLRGVDGENRRTIALASWSGMQLLP